MERGANLVEQIEKFVTHRRGDWSPERIQELAISFLMMQSLSKSDVKEFACVMRLWMRNEQGQRNERKLELAQLKYNESKHDKIKAGFEALAADFRKKPEAFRLYKLARDAYYNGEGTTNNATQTTNPAQPTNANQNNNPNQTITQATQPDTPAS
jgi:hypothetical protein